MKVERKEDGLSTGHQGMNEGPYVLVSQIKPLRIRSITETEPSIKVLHSRIGLYCFPFQSAREKIRVHFRAAWREKARTGTRPRLREPTSKLKEIAPAS